VKIAPDLTEEDMQDIASVVTSPDTRYIYLLCEVFFLFGNRKRESGAVVGEQCWGSVTFWYGLESGSADPYLWLMDPDPAPDPTTFFNDFKDF
jgi:hypothetical protein